MLTNKTAKTWEERYLPCVTLAAHRSHKFIDRALLLAIIAGGDPYDATTSNKSVPNYVKSLKGKKTFTIGVPDDYFDGVDSEIVSAVHESIALFENKGHKVKKIKLTHPKYVISVYTVIQRAEVSSNLARFDGIRYGQSRKHFGEEAKRRIMLGAYTLAHGYYDEYYKKAQKVRSVIMHDFDRIFKEVDMIVSPTTPVTALKLGEYKKYPFFGELMDSLNEPASIAGLPGISIPVGKDKKGLPIGMQIISRAFDEETMLSLAYQYEQETGFGGVLQVPEKFR
ncbi:MAG: amidase [Candidatus Paceibacterota bacterium]